MTLKPWMTKALAGLATAAGAMVVLHAVTQVEGAGAVEAGLPSPAVMRSAPPPPPPPGEIPGGVVGGVIGGVVGGTAKEVEVGLREVPESPGEPRDARLIRRGELALQVAEVARAREAALQRVKALGGWVADQTEHRDGDGRLSAALTLRLPADRFESGQASLRDLGTVQRFHLETEDVSREWVDREARLQVKRAAAQRLRQLLLEKSASLKDVLAAEQALVRLTEEIESLESVHRFQARQVAFATLELSLSGPEPVVARSATGPLARFGDQLVTRLSASLAVLGLFLAALIPWALVALLVRFLFHRRRLRAPAPEASHGSAL